MQVLTLGKVTLDDRVELRVAKPTADEPIQERRESRDRSRCDDPAVSHNPTGPLPPSWAERRIRGGDSAIVGSRRRGLINSL